MAVESRIKSRSEFDLLYNDLSPLVGRVSNPAMEIRHLTTNFLLKASYLGEDWLHARFPIRMRNSQTLKEKTFDVDMLDGLAGLYLLTKSMQTIDPENEAFYARNKPNASLIIGAAADFILNGGIFFSEGTINLMDIAEEKTMLEITRRMNEGNKNLLLAAGMGALAWALKEPLTPQIPDVAGISKEIQELEPIHQQMMIQRLFARAMKQSDVIPNSFSRADYTLLAKSAGIHSKLGKFYFSLVKRANKLL